MKYYINRRFLHKSLIQVESRREYKARVITVKGRLICIAVLSAAFLMPLVCSPISATSTTLVYVDPEKNSAGVGANFVVDIKIADVVDLYALELRLGWNSTVLNVTEWQEGDFLSQGGVRNTFPGCKVYNDMGYLLFSNVLLGVGTGTDGSGTLVSIKFIVKSVGESTLDLYGVGMANSFIKPITDFLVEDGSFTESYLELLAKYTELKSDYDELLASFDSLKSSNDELLADFAELKSSYDNLQADFDSLRSSHEDLFADFTELESSYNNLNSDFEALQSSYDSLLATHDSLNANYVSLQTKSEGLESRNQALADELMNSRNLSYILIGTTAIFLAVSILAILRRPK